MTPILVICITISYYCLQHFSGYTVKSNLKLREATLPYGFAPASKDNRLQVRNNSIR
jgi:hypothetical protein